MSATIKYSDKFRKKVETQFNGNVEVIKALQDGSPFLGELMNDEASAIHDLYLDWAKVEMHKHFAEEGS